MNLDRYQGKPLTDRRKCRQQVVGAMAQASCTIAKCVSKAASGLACGSTALICTAAMFSVTATADSGFGEDVDKVLAQQADLGYGDYLSGECLTCHRSGGASTGVPPIAGLPAAYIIRALLDYQQGTRDNQVMKLVAAGMGDSELASVAAFVESLGNNK